jgi:uncharacterized membrane protein YdjX (TVP38/TMEM64 family)
MKVSRVKRWRNRLPSLIPAFFFFGSYIALLVLFIIYRNSIIPKLQEFGQTVKGYGVGGYVVLACLQFISCFPPIPGYGPLTALSGAIFGWWGLIPSFIGAFLGAVACFWTFRTFGFNYAQRLVEANPKLAAIVHAVENEGFRLFFFMRLAPYPYNLMNSLFGASRVTFVQFSLATLLTLPKLSLDIAVGANLDKISDSLLDKPTVLNWAIFVGLVVVAVGTIVWIVWIGRRAIQRMPKVPETQMMEERVDEEWVVDEDGKQSTDALEV